MEITLRRGVPHQINGLVVRLVDRDTAILAVEGAEAPQADNAAVEGADAEETEAA